MMYCRILMHHKITFLRDYISQRNKTNTGGTVKCDQAVPSSLNKSGSSRAKHAGEANEPDWEHEGEIFKDEPARQCAGEDDRNKYCTVCDTKYTKYKKYCPECTADTYYFKRCTNCAEPGKETCKSHGGTHVMTKMDSDMAKAGSMTNGLTMPTILLCNEKCAMSDYCEYFEVLVDEKKFGSVYPRCLPEQMMYDAVVAQFNKEYELDGVADQIMLDSLAMSIVRRERGRRIVSASGELTERVRSMPDGSFETWFEANAISSVVDGLDRRVMAWLKELNVTKAAREGSVTTKNINLINMLSSEDTSKIEDTVIDVVLEDELN